MIQNALRLFKQYWIALGFVIGLIAMFWITSDQRDVIASLEADIGETESLIAEVKANRDELEKGFNAEKHQEVIKMRTISAEAIGKEIIAVDDALTEFYKTNEPFPEDETKKEALFSKLEDAQVKNTKLTGARDSDHIKTWQLNPDWKLNLETVITYQDTNRLPVVFSMTTKAGKAAGLIHAIYNVDKNMLESISRHYTTDGLKDEVDVGGI